MNKYNNEHVKLDGFTFDSKMESRRYLELKILERAGQIKGLQIHPKFLLQPAFRKNGMNYLAIHYEADFAYYDLLSGKNIVEDVKGRRTQLYILKRKLFEYKYPDLEIKEVQA